MSHRFYLFLFLFLLNFSAHSRVFNMVKIQTVSSSQKTFVVKWGKKEGIYPGQEAVFTIDSVSLVARAQTVTHEYSLWKVINPRAIVPFEKGQMVSMNQAGEHTWTQLPSPIIKRELEAEKLRWQRQVGGQAYHLRVGYMKGIKEVVSDVDPGIQGEREGMQLEGIYERFVVPNLSFGVGLRLEREVNQLPKANLVSTRFYALGDINYYFATLANKHHLYSGLTLGAGLSQTRVDNITLKGQSFLLPGLKIGLDYLTSEKKHVQYELGFEWLSIIESLPGADDQASNQFNLRLAVGFKFPF